MKASVSSPALRCWDVTLAEISNRLAFCLAKSSGPVLDLVTVVQTANVFIANVVQFLPNMTQS